MNINDKFLSKFTEGGNNGKKKMCEMPQMVSRGRYVLSGA
jgi:hypothetical protein